MESKVKKETLKILERYEKNKGKKVKLSKFDNPEKYFKLIKDEENNALSEIGDMKFK